MSFPILLLFLLGGGALALSAASSDKGNALSRRKRKSLPRGLANLSKVAAILKQPKNQAIADDLLKSFSGGNPNDYPAPYSWSHTQSIAGWVLKAASEVMPKPGENPELGQKVRGPYIDARDRFIRIQQSSMTNADKALATIWHVILFSLNHNNLWWWYHKNGGPSLAKNEQLAAVANWVGMFFLGPETATAPVAMKNPAAPWTSAIPVVKGLDGVGAVYLAASVMRSRDVKMHRRLITAVLHDNARWYPNHAQWMIKEVAALETYTEYGLNPSERFVAGNLKALEKLIALNIVIVAEYIEAPDVVAMEKSFALSFLGFLVIVITGVLAPQIASAISAASAAAGSIGAAITGMASTSISTAVSAGIQAAVGAGVTALLSQTSVVVWPKEFAKIEAGVKLAQEAEGFKG